MRTDSARRHHNPITYKRRRSLRTRSVSVDVDESASSPPIKSYSRSDTPASTASCSPIPAHVSTRTRKRRRRLPPLKNRLARVARSRLPRKRPQACSQPPAPVFSPSEQAEEEIKPDIMEPNVTQRRLAAPENYTIPDLKDLLNSKPHVPTNSPPIPTNKPPRLSDMDVPRNPAPRFVLPPRNTIRAPQLIHEFKSPRGRRKEDVPRLNFVALEAHQEQVVMRSGGGR
jgi:hypothetical protein